MSYENNFGSFLRKRSSLLGEDHGLTDLDCKGK